MNPRENLKKIVSHPMQLPLPSEEFVENAEVLEWRRRTGSLATLICYSVVSLLWQQEAAHYSSGIPETSELMQSDLSEMVSHTWNMFDRLKILTYGSPAWWKISQSERQALRDWMSSVTVVLQSFR